MNKWQSDLLRRRSDGAASGDDQANPRIRDADGQQLALTRAAMRAELEWVEQALADASADLGLESSNRRRAARARTRKNGKH